MRSRLFLMHSRVRTTAAALTIGLGSAAGTACAAESAEVRAEAYRGITRVAEVMALARDRYVDEKDASFERLGEGAVRGLLSTLDEYSEFMSAETVRDLGESVAGEFGGLGVWVGRREGELRVEGVLPTGPAWRAGLRAGDRVVGIDGQATDTLEPGRVSALLRGEPGTRVSVRVHRPGDAEPSELVIERAAIDLPSSVEMNLRPDGIGWIRILHFNERTPDDLDEALNQLAAQNLRAIALDLRDNPGGLMQSAVLAAGRFLPANTPVASTDGRTAEDRRQFRAPARGRPVALPLAVLINGGTASAAEIMAGALQDHRRAVLIGERSFGKAMVQSILPLEDGSAVRLTTARYYTPSGRMIHREGIEPDIAVATPRGPPPTRAGPRAHDPALQRAVEMLHGLLALETAGRASDS